MTTAGQGAALSRAGMNHPWSIFPWLDNETGSKGSAKSAGVAFGGHLSGLQYNLAKR
jgi:hypothetical protein